MRAYTPRELACGIHKRFNPGQARDSLGRFASSGGARSSPLLNDFVARHQTVRYAAMGLPGNAEKLLDTAYDALENVGLAHGEVRAIRFENAHGAAGLKEANCSVVIDDAYAQWLVQQGKADEVTATVIHETVHARGKLLQHDVEYEKSPGYEEGMTELATMLAVWKNGIRYESNTYVQYQSVYLGLADAVGVPGESLVRALYNLPPGYVREGLPSTVRKLRIENGESAKRVADTDYSVMLKSLDALFDAKNVMAVGKLPESYAKEFKQVLQ